MHKENIIIKLQYRLLVRETFTILKFPKQHASIILHYCTVAYLIKANDITYI